MDSGKTKVRLNAANRKNLLLINYEEALLFLIIHKKIPPVLPEGICINGFPVSLLFYKLSCCTFAITAANQLH